LPSKKTILYFPSLPECVIIQAMKDYNFFNAITGFFVAVLLISNVASSKIVDFGPFTFDGGTILFPISYIFGDILTEVYGYRKSRQVIWIGFASALLMTVVFEIIGFLPSAPGWENQEAYRAILGTTPRIVAASLTAYFAGEFSNSYILAKLKIFTQGRWLFTRTIGSTIVGQGVDTLFFCCIAFAGTIPGSTLIALIVSNYVFKVGFEVAATPLTYAVVGFLKKNELTDVYDYKTNFNPFVELWNARPGFNGTVDQDGTRQR
jgi:queuosine precursor transporter